MKKVLHLFLLLFLFFLKAFSQINYPFKLDTINVVPSSRINEVIDSFMNQAKAFRYVEVQDNFGNIKKTPVDSLFSIIKKNVINIGVSYKKNPLDEIDITKRNLVQPIFKEIQRVNHIVDSINKGMPAHLGHRLQVTQSFLDGVEIKLNEVFNLIYNYKDSKEKIWLLLQYYNSFFFLYSKDSISASAAVTHLRKSCLAAQKTADKIIDLFERGLAYSYIGMFASKHLFKDIAISSFYSAKEFIYNSEKEYKLKKFQEGVINEEIAMIFNYANSCVEQSLIKKNNYYGVAAECFKEAGDTNRYYEDFLYLINGSLYLVNQPEYYNSDTLIDYIPESLILGQLVKLHNNFVARNKDANIVEAYIISSIGTFLRIHNKIKEARNYLVSALFEALKIKNVDLIYYCLDEIALTYTLSGQKKLALSYSDLAIELSEILHDKIKIFEYTLSKAACFYNLKDYKSALIYTNKVEEHSTTDFMIYRLEPFDDVVSIVYESEPLIEINTFVYYLKYHIFLESKADRDSIEFFKYQYDEFVKRQIREFAQLVQVESFSIVEWLDRIKEKETDSQREEKEKLAVLSKELKGTINSLRIVSFGAALVSIILLIVYLVYRRNSRKLLAFTIRFRIASTNEEKYRAAIKNHNLGNHYSKIKEMLEQKRINQAEDYCDANSNYFDKYYTAVLQEKISLQEEMKIFESFIQTERIYKNKEFKIIYNFENIDMDKTVFLTDIFIPLYENALVKGFTGNRNDYSFTISIKKVSYDLHCTISDNGEGSENIKSMIRKNSYLGMLQDRVNNQYFRISRVVNPDEVFSIVSVPGKGTTIKFKLPYEPMQDNYR